tara:strand:- start:3305 stop:3703 length:399 start_codon:yes stop_codon:yes gene_type:complete
MKKEFILPEEDMEFLNEYNSTWEAIIELRHKWLILNDYPVPEGYNIKSTVLALRIDAGYPNSQIDMVYFKPALIRVDGKPIKALANQPLLGTVFQRWSRHRTPLNPWRPGIDNLETHLLLVNNWMQREFQIR